MFTYLVNAHHKNECKITQSLLRKGNLLFHELADGYLVVDVAEYAFEVREDDEHYQTQWEEKQGVEL